jgi:hypothetical protein
MIPKQLARPGAVGSSIFLVAFLAVLFFAQVTTAGPTVTVYKSPT